MNARTLALLATIGAGGVLFFMVPEEITTAAGVAGSLLCLAAIWLASGTVRRVLAVVAGVAWIGALILALGDSAIAVVASLVGLSGAALTAARGASWPGWSSRYARSADIAEDEVFNPRTMWESLDRGVDPTRDADAGPDD